MARQNKAESRRACRAHAERLRKLASTVTTAGIRKTLMEAAADYDMLARRHDALAKRPAMLSASPTADVVATTAQAETRATHASPTAHLVFRCHAANRVVMSGVAVDGPTFRSLHITRTVPCRFCGQEHAWEIVDKLPEAAALMSLRAEDFLGRSIQSEAYAAQAIDPEVRRLYQRMAGQLYQLAIEHETKAGLL